MFSLSKIVFWLLMPALLTGPAVIDANIPSGERPEYTADGELKLPEHYREWIYLSADFHPASPSAEMQKGGHDRFLNVFANPQAYEEFVRTGTWPDKTMLVVESRAAQSVSMNNQNGQVQGSLEGIAVHLKDETRFAGKWAFFGFHGEKTSKVIPLTANCYSCHSAHGEVDTTFVQFYPTLLPIAKNKGTLSRGLDSSTPTAKP